MNTKKKIEMPEPFVTTTSFDVGFYVIGTGWYNQKIATHIELSKHDLENIDSFDRETVSDYLDSHSGDFQTIIDFKFHCGEESIDWKDPDNECEYGSIMFGDDE